MGDQPVLILLLAAVLLVVLANVAVWVRSLLRPVRPAKSVDAGTAPPWRPGAGGFGRPLVRGFSYLFSPLGLPRRRRYLSDRLDRALQRIGQVDPYATHRRIGLALLAAAPTEAAEQDGPAPAAHPPTASTPRPPGEEPADPRETRR